MGFFSLFYKTVKLCLKIGTNFHQYKRYQLNDIISGRLMSIPPFIGLSSPAIGFMLSKFGNLTQFLILGNIFSIISLAIFLF